MKAFVFGLGLLLTACATLPSPSQVITQEVKVPIAVLCVSSLPSHDPYPDSQAAVKAANTLFDKVKLILAGRSLRDAFEAEQGAVLQACLTPNVKEDSKP
jgi:hypothetical protein